MTPSPAVTAHAWGRIEVDGRTFKDVKLFPGGARAWDWRETGTRHRPGIQPADVEELVAAGATVVVLSRGVLRALCVPDATVAWLEARGVRVEVLQTDEAVAAYNALVGVEPVGALLHSTC
ncbi:MAG: Mth938-like domain-containing protein [Myxococcota bacterium]